MKRFLTAIALLAFNVQAEYVVDSTRATTYDYACIGPSGFISGHQRFDTAEAACLTKKLNDPEGEYEVQGGRWRIRFNSALSQVLVVAPPAAENNAPTWEGTPAPVFTEGVADTYDLCELTADADEDSLTCALATCSPPTGITDEGGVLTATTGTSAGTTASCTATVSDGEASPVSSSSFSIVVNEASEGAVDHGDSVILTGTGFEVVTPGLWDTVDNIATYSSLGDGDTIPTNSPNPWSSNTTLNPGRVKYETGSQRHGDSTASYRGATPAYLDWPRATGGNNAPESQDELYISFWFRPDETIPSEGHSSKFIRIWDDPNGTGTRNSWTQNHLDYDLTGSGFQLSWNGWGGSANNWNRLDVYYDIDSGTFDAWTNRSQRHNVSNAGKNSGGAGDGFNLFRIGFDTGGDSPPSLNIDFDDIYVATSPGRVELCNNATYASATQCEIQPATSASSTSITISVNRGTFTSGTYHLHIIDGDNAHDEYYGELELE